ncbi:N-formylglutamate amidohydrolase [Mesorhizobium sp.]|uniref:N-formylglutamate amidohydrolase n=1 Tax=Mesorhizobium sp. TaxID=1871066 RepID=UPI000FE56B92|nr:N-formylglutamate amidohydrolase [Mesorhizobium sp.]RWB69692.1 MAG: N-formylglutamate amidohydrolase [Mesorhizobium sp.]
MPIESLFEWPAATEIIESVSANEIVLICEHASNYIPAEYSMLGLNKTDVQRHIAWDVGAAELTRRLAARLGATAFLGTYSRLLIDLNRPVGSAESIPRRSENTTIPGNRNLPPDEIARREEMIFGPFHAAVRSHLDSRRAEGLSTKLVTIHSFTPVYLGVSRPWHVGVLFGRAEQFAEKVLNGLRVERSLNAAMNQPYVVSRESDYAIPIHGDDRGIDAVLLEIRNDLISTSAGAESWAARLGTVLSEESTAPTSQVPLDLPPSPSVPEN